MRIQVTEGRAIVNWNDQGQNCEINIQGIMVNVDDEQVLRDLYQVLDFLFGKPR